jgi:ATP-dependent Clp protease adaptor protein ClpS
MGRVATPYLLNKIMTTELDVKVDSKIQQIVKTPKNYHVMDFVVELLVKIFKHSPDTAKNLTMKIHTEGSAIVGTYTYELAEQKGTEATNESRSRGFPLQVKIDQE